MILRQYLEVRPVVAASYLFGCRSKAMGAVVDPTIRYAIDTHVHADHISGGRRLAEAAGAEYVLFAGTKAGYAFREVADGDVLNLGNVSARVLHTPGHTPEHIARMIGDMGRTELASTADDGARALFDALRRRSRSAATTMVGRGSPSVLRRRRM